jgi:predicted RecA/RadA family phage recombinase
MPDILKCRIEDCHMIQHVVASPGVSEGDMDLVEDTVYVWLEDYATGEIGVKIIEAERITLPKETGVAFSMGDDVFYDDSTNSLNATGVGRYWCGKARTDAALTDTTVEVDFQGNDARVVT